MITSRNIAFDVDGIVLDTATEMWKVVTDYLGLPWSIKRWTNFRFEKVLGIPAQELRHVYDPVLARHDLPGYGDCFNQLMRVYTNTGKQPILFVTARRAEFKEAAISSLHKILDPIPFELICTGEHYEDSERMNKTWFLTKNNINIFVDDCPEHWQEYINNNISVYTFDLPWTRPYRMNHPKFKMATDWEELYQQIKQEQGWKF